jgi:TDG/mug DNA glycosylase family protein
MPVLDDVLAPGLRAVICGSAVSAASARAGAYYANPQNRFWRTLHEVGLTPRELAPADYRRLIDHGIGLTDLAKHESGADWTLSRSAYDPGGLAARVAPLAPGVLAFNGKTPAKAFFGGAALDYGRQPGGLGAIPVFVLPSTSPAARRYWDIAPWRDFAAFVKGAKAEK